MTTIIDLSIGSAAVLTLGFAAWWPRRVHPITAGFMALLTAALLWANLRPGPWQAEYNMETPPGLDPITGAMFWRGWPLAPVMICLMTSLRFRPSGGEEIVLVIDGGLFLVALYATKIACEWLLRWRRSGLS